MTMRGCVVATMIAWGLASPLVGQGPPVSGGNATIYMGSYEKAVYVIAESTFTVTRKLPVSVGQPLGLTLSHDRSRLYVRDATFEHIEVFDLASGQSVDRFTLSKGNAKVRIWNIDVDPRQQFAVLLIKQYTKLADRFEVGPPTLLRYDLATHTVRDTIPWPEDEERDFVRILFSPDGRLMYFFSDDILIYETETLKEVDRWQLSEPLEGGMGRFNFGFPSSLYEEPGFYTGLFRMNDPVQNRRLMGIARVNLAAKTVDFTAIGPHEPVSFTLAPDRRTGYGLKQRIGEHEFWEFDVANRRVVRRVPFRGRPRMALATSSNGQLLYIYNAGSTFDVYDASTFEHLRTVTLDSDMIGVLIVPPGPASGSR